MTGQGTGPVTTTVLIAEVRAALAAGAPPGPALAAAVRVASERGATRRPRHGLRPARQADGSGVEAVGRRIRLGAPVAEVAETIATGDPSADLLVRALGVVERAGAGALAAVDQVLAAVRDEAALRRLLRVRTTQARGTAAVLTLIPLLVWVLLVAVDGAALRFYRTPGGAATGLAAVCLAGCGQWWSRRLVGRAAGAAAAADPLAAPVAPWRPARAAVVAVPALLVLGAGAGPGVGVLVAVAAGVLAARPAREPARARSSAAQPDLQAARDPRSAAAADPGLDARGAAAGLSAAGAAGAAADGGAAETVELVAMALQAGLAPTQAVACVAPLAPPAARAPLGTAAGRLRAGWQAGDAFEGTGLAVLGGALDACERWGAPAGEVLCRVAEDLRADRRAAAEEAAERTQLALIFPTTLLTLPAFVLGVVPPLLWTAFGS